MNLYTSNIKQLFTAFILLFLLSGCGTKATEVDSDTVTDLSGRWKNSDSRLVADEMIQDVLSRDWLSKFNQSQGKAPTVIVGTVRNLSHEHINTRTFIADMERALINSAKVKLVASVLNLEEVRADVKDQYLHASDETGKTAGQEIVADFMLQGSINSAADAISAEQTRLYQIDLTLIDLATKRKVWVGQKKVRKTVKKDGSSL